MKNKRIIIRNIIITLIAILMLSAIGFAFTTTKNKSGTNINFSNVTIEGQYFYGDIFTVPSRTFGEKQIPATSTVISPDGSATVLTTFVLDKAGVWTIRYSAVDDGKYYTLDETFSVTDKAFKIDSQDSSAEYRHVSEFGSDADALVVTLAQGDTLTFNKTVDLNNLKASDVLVKGFVIPKIRGVADFGRIVVTFTDVEDPNVYFEYQINRWKNSEVNGLSSTYISARGNGQNFGGIEAKSGIEYLHMNEGTGCPIPHSFVALTNINGWSGPTKDIIPSQQQFSLSLDLGSNISYANGKKIIDHDSVDYYNDLWFGFKSGKVKITIKGDLYNSSTAIICLTELYGIDLTEEITTDKKAPVITINTDYDVMPEAKLNVAYTIPTATGYDEYCGDTSVQTSIYYNYASASPETIAIYDGKFVPTKYGMYTIIYTSQDDNGNIATKTINVHAGNDIAPLQASITPSKESGKVGEIVILDDPIVSGGSGNVTWTIEAKHEQVIVPVTSTFTPELEGEWTIEYTVKDYVGNTTKASYIFTALENNQPIFDEILSYPSIMIVGSSYTIPKLLATVYQDDVKSQVVTNYCIKNVDNEILYQGVSGTSVKLTEDAPEKIYLTYSYGGYSTESKEILVSSPWTVNSINFAKLFCGEGFTATNDDFDETGRGVLLTSNVKGNYTAQFATSQKVANFNVLISSVPNTIDEESGNIENNTLFDGFKIILLDCDDSNNSISVTVMKNNQKLMVTVGEQSFEMKVDFTALISNSIEIGYKEGKLVIGTVSIEVKNNDNGDVFTGFKSDKLKLFIEVIGNEIGAKILVTKINDYTFNAYAYDLVAPYISIQDDIGGMVNPNTVYHLKAANAYDVLCPFTTLTVTVCDPNNNVIKDINGNLLKDVDGRVDYDFLVTMIGDYKIVYSSSEVDWKNRRGKPNSTTSNLMIHVMDVEAPTITFNGTFDTIANLNDVVIIPDFTVNDNVSKAENIIVSKYVLNPNGVLITLKGNSIKCTNKGIYEFRISVEDEVGNITVYRHQFEVK